MDHPAIRADVQSFMQTVPSSGRIVLYLSEYHASRHGGTNLHHVFNKQMIVAHMRALNVNPHEVVIVDELGITNKLAHSELFDLGTWWKSEGSILTDANQINVDFASAIIGTLGDLYLNGNISDFARYAQGDFMSMFELNNPRLNMALEPVNFIIRFAQKKYPGLPLKQSRFIGRCLLKKVHVLEDREYSSNYDDMINEATLESFNVGVREGLVVKTKTIGLFKTGGPLLINFVLKNLIENVPGIAAEALSNYWSSEGDREDVNDTAMRRLCLIRDHFISQYVNDSAARLTVVIMGMHHFENMTSLLRSARVVPKEWYLAIHNGNYEGLLSGTDNDIRDILRMYTESIAWSPPESRTREPPESADRPAKKPRTTKLRF